MSAYRQPFLLSKHGSDRATAYVHANKCVTRAGLTHVVWTDAVAVTQGRTFDHRAGTWGETITIGVGRDNHNDPCLTADKEGQLRIAFGPHGDWDQLENPEKWPSGKFKVGAATEPGSLASITQFHPVGYGATYAFLLHLADGRDALAYRGGEQPFSVQFQVQRPLGGWTHAQPLMAQDIKPQYTHYGASLAAAPDGTLYAGAHFYNIGTKRSAGVGILKSPDGGLTWLDLKGRRLALPALYGKRIAVPSFAAADSPYNGGLAVAPDGALWALVYASAGKRFPLRLSRWDGKAWDTINLDAVLPPERGVCQAILSLDAAGRLHILAAAVERARFGKDDQTFGHPSLQVFHLWTDPGKTAFRHRMISDGDPEIPSWHPSLSLPGPFHPVEKPVLLFTKGRNQAASDTGCRHTLETDVYCVLPE
jgi:hypothetical protein